MTKFIQATTAKELEQAAALFREYAGTLGCSPCLQNIEKELGHLPGEYGPPEGRLILAKHDGTIRGCVAFRTESIWNASCEGSGTVVQLLGIILRTPVQGTRIITRAFRIISMNFFIGTLRGAVPGGTVMSLKNVPFASV